MPDPTTSQQQPGRLSRMAWLPTPLFLVTIAGLWAADPRTSYESPGLLTAFNFIFSTLASLAVALLMARGFLARPLPGKLMLGCGVLIWGLGSLAAPLVGTGNTNITFTVHNLSVWLAACCHLAGVSIARRPLRSAAAPGIWVGAAYAAALGLVCLIAESAFAGRLPLFFVQDAGGTLARQFLLASTISLLVLTAGLLRPAQGAPRSAFAFWYTNGLLLLATGLFGVMIQSVGGGLLGWTGRAAQYLGGVYMIAAACVSGREAGGGPLLPEAVHGAARQRHLAAVVIVITGVAVRLVFLQGLGNSAPYVTFYPAVIIAALYGGLRSGLLATVLSAVLADYYLIPPSGFGIGNPADWLGLAVFLLSGAMISWITGTMLRARARANEAEIQARLAAERELGAAALRESEERFRILADAAFEGIAITEAGRFTDVNDQFARMLGYEPDELRGREVSILLPAEDRERVVAGIHAGAESHIEHAMMRRDGRLITVEAHGRNTTYRDRSVRITAVRDISERRRAEERLQSELDLLQAVMNGAKNSHLVYLDHDFNFVRVNETYARTCGYRPEEMIGRNHFDLYPNADNEAIFSRVRDTGESFEVRDKAFEFPDQPERGVTYWDWSLTPVKGPDDRVAGLVFSLFETTERKRAQETLRLAQNELEKRVAERTRELARTVEVLQTEIVERRELEQQLLQSQKLESIGLLAGGVAHDFNNLLNGIYGYGEIILESIPRDDELLRESVEQVLKAASRAAELTRSLLAFSRKQEIHPKAVLIDDIIAATGKLIKRVIGEDIEFVTDYRAGDLLVMADSGQMEQVLMNLATNARDAMPGGGRLTVSSRRIVVEKGSETQYDLPLPGEYALISVTDTGTGIDRDSLERLFEPFYTTKEVGKGTGLGLSIVYGIVKQHNGSVLVGSEPGTGTTVSVYLPLIAGRAAVEAAEVPTPPSGGSETLLVAEDEEIVRDLLKKILERAGYTVLVAADGEEAVTCFRERSDISLVLSDVVMPRKTGSEMLEEIRRTDPDIRVIFISGYAADVMHLKGVTEQNVDIVTKPIRKNDLLRTIREALDRK